MQNEKSWDKYELFTILYVGYKENELKVIEIFYVYKCNMNVYNLNVSLLTQCLFTLLHVYRLSVLFA